MAIYRLNWNASKYEHGRYHAVNLSDNLVYQFKNLSDLNLLKVKQEKTRSINNDEEFEYEYLLDNDILIRYEDARKAYVNIPDGDVFFKVYDVQNAVDGEYSFYEDEDFIGFIGLCEADKTSIGVLQDDMIKKD